MKVGKQGNEELSFSSLGGCYQHVSPSEAPRHS